MRRSRRKDTIAPMKADMNNSGQPLHPKWYPDCKVTCACGNNLVVGATVPSIRVEICAKCHPFYTGKMRYVDTAGRVEAFKTKQAKAVGKIVSKTEKRKLKKAKKIAEERELPESLTELRKKVKK